MSRYLQSRTSLLRFPASAFPRSWDLPAAGRQPCSTSLVASISQPKEPSSWAGTRQETEDVGRTLERKRDST